MNELLDYYQALDLLKNGVVLMDENVNSFYVLKNDKVINYRNGCRFAMSLNDFETLFIKHCFKIYEYQDAIDESKDIEYYGFKHK